AHLWNEDRQRQGERASMDMLRVGEPPELHEEARQQPEVADDPYDERHASDRFARLLEARHLDEECGENYSGQHTADPGPGCGWGWSRSENVRRPVRQDDQRGAKIAKPAGQL